MAAICIKLVYQKKKLYNSHTDRITTHSSEMKLFVTAAFASLTSVFARTFTVRLEVIFSVLYMLMCRPCRCTMLAHLLSGEYIQFFQSNKNGASLHVIRPAVCQSSSRLNRTVGTQHSYIVPQIFTDLNVGTSVPAHTTGFVTITDCPC